MNKKNLDPITTEIIQSSLQAACDEMFVAMRKTAMSSIIYEVLDFGTAVTDAKGNIAASGAGIPAFIAMCDKAVQAVIKKFNDSEINEGDVFATNAMSPVIYEVLDFIKAKMAGLLSPDIQETVTGTAQILEIFKVSGAGKVAGSKVMEGEITTASFQWLL